MKRIILVILIIFVQQFVAAQEFPTLKSYATDFSGTLSSSELSIIENDLRTFDDSTSTQIALLMVNTLDGYPIEMFAYEVASRNKIGTKNNNGILVCIALQDRKIRIEVGYGLEGSLTDALSSSIIRNEIGPYFKKGEYYSGVKAGLNAIKLAVKGEYKRDDRGDNTDDVDFKFFGYIIMIIIYILFSILRRGKRIISVGGFGTGISGGSFGGGSSWGGGSGFGGFSGGGGSFGGGGSSGSW